MNAQPIKGTLFVTINGVLHELRGTMSFEKGRPMTDTEAKLCDLMQKRHAIDFTPESTPRILATPFERLGFNSLEIVEVVMDCEQAHRIEIPDDALQPDLTPAALAELVDRIKGRCI